MTSIQSIECLTWYEFKERIMPDLFSDRHYKKGLYIFRGHASVEWRLESSFDRCFPDLPGIQRKAVAEKLLECFRTECEGMDIDPFLLTNRNRFLALAQHHGLPTRLLDWTESPYAAAFFAMSGALFESSEAGEAAIWVLDMQNGIWSDETGVEIIKVPTIGNERLRNQQGLFSYARTPDKCLEEYAIRNGGINIPLKKYIIPHDQARIAIADLGAMNISHSSFFPGLSGFAQSAKLRVMLET